MYFFLRYILGVGIVLLVPVCFAAPFAYITNNFSNDVSVIDIATNTVVGPPIAVGVSPIGVAVNPAGTRVYVANNGSSTVSVIDTATNTVLGSPIDVRGSVSGSAIGLVVNPAGNRLYVANGQNFPFGGVSVIDTATNLLITAINVNNEGIPYGIAINPAGTRVYVTNQATNSVSVIDTTANAVIAPLITSGISAPRGVAVNPAGTFVYVANGSTVSVIETTNHIVVTTISAGIRSPRGLVVNPAGDRLYVANSGNGTVAVIDTASNMVITTVPVGASPFGIAVNPAGTRVYVANSSNNDNSISVINTADNTVLGVPIIVGSQPNAFGLFIGPLAGNVPSAPTINAATPGNGQVQLAFSDPASNGGSPITGYIATCNPGAVSVSGMSSPLTVAGLSNGTAYSCSVSAINAIGTGAASASVIVTPATVPGTARLQSIVPENGQLKIYFLPPASNGGSAVTGYNVTCNPGNVSINGMTSPITVPA